MRTSSVFLTTLLAGLAAPVGAGAMIQIDRGIAGARLNNTQAEVRAALGKPGRVVNGMNDFGPFRVFRYKGRAERHVPGQPERHLGKDQGPGRPHRPRRRRRVDRAGSREPRPWNHLRNVSRRLPLMPHRRLQRRHARDRLRDQERQGHARHGRLRDRLIRPARPRTCVRIRADGREQKCYGCGEVKPVEDFAWRRKAKGQRDSLCRPCRAAYGRAHYEANRQRYIDQAALSKQKLRLVRTKYLIEFFETHPCVDCGETDPVVLEFDHLRDKSFSIGAKLPQRKWQTILDEIEKCEVVCANCHRRRTAQRRGAMRAVLTQP